MINVRPAAPDDLDDIVRLYLVLREHHHALEPTNPRYLVGESEWHAVAQEALTDPSSQILVASTDDRIIGFTRLRLVDKPWGTGCEMDTIVVDPLHRSGGGGRRLIAAAETWAKQQGATAMRANVLAVNDRARAFYEREGYDMFAVRYGKPL